MALTIVGMGIGIESTRLASAPINDAAFYVMCAFVIVFGVVPPTVAMAHFFFTEIRRVVHCERLRGLLATATETAANAANAATTTTAAMVVPATATEPRPNTNVEILVTTATSANCKGVM